MTGSVICDRCGEGNAADQRFCGSCGAALVRACPSCGTSNPASFRFCGSCGGSLETTGPAPVPEGAEERRWATVLFGDLSGFTKLSEGMDPEDVRTLVDDCMAKLSEIVERYQGRVERVTGDEIMVVFGAPTSHEDDPERAVRTGLEMQRCAAEHTASFGGLPLRVGVNTGEVMFAPVGPEGARQHTVMGDAVNTASRLESAAPTGGVLVGHTTYEATKRAISYREVDPVDAKGKDQPVGAWLALEPVGEPAARPMSEAPILGRDHELRLLKHNWERVVGDRQAHLVTVIGPPGIGKSKLVREFVATIDNGRALWGRSLPYGQQAGGAFGQIVRQIADAYVTDDAEVARSKLEAATRELTAGDGTELARHLATIVGVGIGEEIERTELFAAALRLVEAMAASHPLVLIFEDIQWADASLLELIQWLVQRLQQSPVLFLTLTRPELLDSHPGWGGGLVAYTTLPLGPLADDFIRELAHRLRSGLGEAELDRIGMVAGGNPLFIEELAAWLTEGGGGGPLPSSITSIVSARLDALPQELRRTLLDASVIGTSFWRGPLEAVPGASKVAEALDGLVARGLVVRQAASRVPGDEEYTFRHHLIRDVAYGILPRSARRERHGAVARFIEGRLGENAALVAGVLANHWKDAGDPERAADYFVEAAEIASAGWEQDRAVELLKQAREIIEPDDLPRKRAINLGLAVARTRRAHTTWLAMKREADDQP